MKFISVCLAVLLWYFVGGEDKVDKNVLIPIEVINLPRDLVISNQYKKEVEVTVNGPRSLILDINKMEITRQVDLSDSKPGSQVVDIAVESIKMPRGITVERVQPNSIILSLDKLILKDFQVHPVTIGEVANGYKLSNLTIEPDVISITGPQSQLSQVEALKTTEINIGGMKESSQIQVPLDLEPSIVELIGETSVTADVQVDMLKVEKKLNDVKVQVVIDGIEQPVKPKTVDIYAKFPQLLLDKKVNLDDLIAVTAVGNDESNRLKVEVIPLSENSFPIEVIRIEPQFVILEPGPSIESETFREDGTENSETDIPVLEETKGKIFK